MTRSSVACLQCRAEMDSTALICTACGTPRGQRGAVTSESLEQLEAWLRSVPDDQLPRSIVRTYQAHSQLAAAQGLAAEAAILAPRGYQTSTQSWAAGDGSSYFVAGAAESRGRGSLTATFVLPGAAVTTTPRPTKRCPDCAEEVLAEARICRFCRHDFGNVGL